MLIRRRQPIVQAPSVNMGHPATTGLVGAWVFNRPGGTRVLDASGNKYHADFVGTSPAWGPSSHGYELDFTGVSGGADLIRVPTELNSNNIRTVIVWASDTAYVSGEVAFGIKPAGASTTGLFLVYPFDGSGGNGCRIYFGTTILNANSSSLADGLPHQFVVVSRSVNDHELYEDGISQGTSGNFQSLPAAIDAVRFGQWNSNSWFSGQLQVVFLFRRALSVLEIRENLLDPYAMFLRRRRVFKPPAAAGIPIFRRRLEKC